MVYLYIPTNLLLKSTKCVGIIIFLYTIYMDPMGHWILKDVFLMSFWGGRVRCYKYHVFRDAQIFPLVSFAVCNC